MNLELVSTTPTASEPTERCDQLDALVEQRRLPNGTPVYYNRARRTKRGSQHSPFEIRFGRIMHRYREVYVMDNGDRIGHLHVHLYLCSLFNELTERKHACTGELKDLVEEQAKWQQGATWAWPEYREYLRNRE